MATEEQQKSESKKSPEDEALERYWAKILESSGLDEGALAELTRKAVVLDNSADLLGDQGPQTDEELWRWFKDRIGVELPRVAVCPGHTAPFEVVCDIHFFRILRLLLIANRGGGKTSLIAWLDICSAETRPGFGAWTTGPGLQQGQRKYEHMLPYVVEGGVIGGDELPHVARSTLTETIWKNGSKAGIGPGTVAANNGPREPRLQRDELELMQEDVIKQAGNIPAGRSTPDGRFIPAQIIDTSTMKYAGGRVARLKEEHDKAIADGKRPRMAVRIFCIYEIAKEVPHCRAAPKEEREARLKDLGEDPCELCDCVAESVLITPVGDLLGGFRRRYEGPLVEITTLSGKRLSVTPNHPVLTSRGWVAANLIEEGDHVVSRPGEDRSLTSDFDQMPVRAEDLFASLEVQVPTVRPYSVAPSPVDFHGDGVFTKGKVDLVSTKLKLPRVRDSSLVEKGSEKLFTSGEGAHESAPAQPVPKSRIRNADLTSECGAVLTGDVPADDLFWNRHKYGPAADAHLSELVGESTDGDPARLRDGCVGLSGEIALDDLLRYLDSKGSATDPELAKVPGQRRSGGADLFSERPDRLSLQVPLDDGVGYVDDSSSSLDSQMIESSSEQMVRDPDLSGEGSGGLPVYVALDEVVEVRDIDWSGHVYNFSTSRGAYIADGILTHNCHTFENDVWDETDDGDQPPRTLEDVCAARLFRSRGFKPLGDIQTAFLENDRETWEAEMECSQPSKEGVYIKGYSQIRCGIKEYDPDPDNGEIYMAVDWGGTDQHAVLWFQLTDRPLEVSSYVGDKKKVIPADSIVVFAEIFRANIGNVDVGRMAVAIEDEWRKRWPGWRVKERYPDYQNAAGRLDWEKHLQLKLTSRIKKDPPEEIKYIRGWVSKRRFYVAIDKAPVFDKAVRTWREKDGHEDRSAEVKWSTHPLAAMRYGIHNIEFIRRKKAVAEKTGADPADLLEQVEDRDPETRMSRTAARHYRQMRQEILGAAGAEDSPNRPREGRLGDL